jgi:hypothetical protein
MCHICDRLGIVIEVPSPEQLKKEAAEEEQLERAREQKMEDEARELITQDKPLPTTPRKVLIPLRRKLVVEPAPSHDGAPSFAAYQILRPISGNGPHRGCGATIARVDDGRRSSGQVHRTQ